MKRSPRRGNAPAAVARCSLRGTQRGQWRLPIAAWLITGFALVIAAFVTGSLLARHSTRSATDELARVRAEIEPLTHASRNLGESSAAFDRAVLAYLGADSIKDRKPHPNHYTIRKNGRKKIIHQVPWFEDGAFAGVVEISIPIPDELPHFNRD